MKLALLVCLLSSFLLLSEARPSFVALIPNGNGVSGVAALGHMNAAGGGRTNPFGEAFSSAGHEWTEELCQKDSDGDGATNGQELGDPCCTWTPLAGGSVSAGDPTHPGVPNTFSHDQLVAMTCDGEAEQNAVAFSETFSSTASSFGEGSSHSGSFSNDIVAELQPRSSPAPRLDQTSSTPATSDAKSLQTSVIALYGLSITLAIVFPSPMVGITDRADLFTRALSGEHITDNTSGGIANSAAIGGFLLCLDVPPATEFGIDYEVFRTGPKFQGVKFLPLGIHFVLFRSREQEHGIRQGFFVNVQRHSQVIVREWSLSKEELGPPRRELNVETLERAVLSFQLDSGLGPYPKQHLKTWQRLSNCISASVLQRCGVEFGTILLPGDAVEDCRTLSNTQDGVLPYRDDLPRTVRFTALQQTRADLTAEARTAYHFDRSERLEELIENEFGGDWQEIIGELQVSFLVFLQLSSLAALEQWKQFIALMCSCERALASHVPLFRAFMRLLRVQLEQIPEDFFQDETSNENFLSPCLLSLLELVEDKNAPNQLRRKADNLRQLLTHRFHWNSHAERELDELAPVIVPEDELSVPDKSNEIASLPMLLPASLANLRRRQDDERTNAAIAAAFRCQHFGVKE